MKDCGLQDYPLTEATVLSRFKSIDKNFEFFTSPSEAEHHLALFKTLVLACRMSIVFFEKNNAEGDNMAYAYAYKLMALFKEGLSGDPAKAFDEISTLTAELLKTASDKNTPYHNLLITALNTLPIGRNIQDQKGWFNLMSQKGVGAKVFPYFLMAPQIEAKLKKRAPENLKEAEEIAIHCRFRRLAEAPEFAKLCLKHKVDEATFDACLDYMKTPPGFPKKDTDSLPKEPIKGRGVFKKTLDTEDKNLSMMLVEEKTESQAADGTKEMKREFCVVPLAATDNLHAAEKDLAEGYYWVKLPPKDERALILGKITDCCQSINGHSETCVKDAVEQEDNGLYVLLKQKKDDQKKLFNKDGSINYEDFQIIGQSYAWKTKTGNLCLDSVECLRDSVPNDVLHQILSDFAKQAVAEDPSIRRVTLGAGGKTPPDVFGEKVPIPEAIKKGAFYGDARTQYLLGKGSDSLTTEEEVILNDLLQDYPPAFQQNMEYLFDYLPDKSIAFDALRVLLETNTALPHALHREALFRFISYSNLAPTLSDLEPIDFNHLASQSLAKLLWQDKTSDDVLLVLPHIPEHYRLEVVKRKDLHGHSILHAIADKPESLHLMLMLLPKAERLEAIQKKNDSNQSLLHFVLDKPDALKSLLLAFPETERLEILEEKGLHRKSALTIAEDKPDTLLAILDVLPEKDRLEVLRFRSNYDNPLRRSIQTDLNFFTALLLKLSDDDAINAFEKLRSYITHKNIKAFFKQIPTEKQPQLLQGTGKRSSNFFHHFISNPDILQFLLDLLPTPEACVTELSKQTSDGDTPLHLAARKRQIDSLLCLLASLPLAARLSQLTTVKDVIGRSVLDVASDSHDTVYAILKLLPRHDRLKALTTDISHGNTLLTSKQLYDDCSKNLDDFLGLLETDDLVKAINSRNDFNQTTLHRLRNIDSLRVVFKRLPESHHLEVLQQKNYQGETPLHTAIGRDFELFQFMLKHIPESERLAALKEKGRHDQPMLDHLGRLPSDMSVEALNLILMHYPEHERLAALQEKGWRNQTIISLRFIQRNPKAQDMLLSLLPIQDYSMDLFQALPKLPLSKIKKITCQKISQMQGVDDDLEAAQKHIQACQSPEQISLALDNLKHKQYIFVRCEEAFRLLKTLKADRLNKTSEITPEAEESLNRFAALLGEIPIDDCLAFITTKNDTGTPLLHHAMRYLNVLEIILSQLPVENLLPAIKEKDKMGRTVLHFFFITQDSQIRLLRQLPEHQRLEAFNLKNNDGKTVLAHIAKNAKSSAMLLNLLPISDYSLDVLEAFPALSAPEVKAIVLNKLSQIEAPAAILEEVKKDIESSETLPDICEHLSHLPCASTPKTPATLFKAIKAEIDKPEHDGAAEEASPARKP